jgi:hypothetical protein
LCVDQMKTPPLLAVAIYTPLTDIASAVMAPEQASSVKMEDLLQSVREMVTSSIDAESAQILEVFSQYVP